MSAFAILLLCVHACLVQSVFGQYFGGCGCGSASAISPIASIGPAVAIGAPCGGSSYGSGAGLAGAYGGSLAGAYGVGLAGAYGAGSGCAYGAGVAPYGGAGEGNVAVIGELPVAGNTAVAGQVPIVGVVSFNGAAPAAGAVSIIGNCACECSY